MRAKEAKLDFDKATQVAACSMSDGAIAWDGETAEIVHGIEDPTVIVLSNIYGVPRSIVSRKILGAFKRAMKEINDACQ